MKKYYWRTLFDGSYPLLMAKMEKHNLCFPTEAEARKHQLTGPTFPRSYPRRIKPGEEKTAVNLLRLACKQISQQINSGDLVVTNKVKANNHTARDGKSCKSGTARHLAKLAYAGIIQGAKASAGSPKVYRDYETQAGKGFGVVPQKVSGGRHSDYTLLMAPDVLNPKNLPRAASMLPLEAVKPLSEAQVHEPPCAAPLPYQSENLAQSKSSEGNPINELMTKKALLSEEERAAKEAIRQLFNQGAESNNPTEDSEEGNPREASRANRCETSQEGPIKDGSGMEVKKSSAAPPSLRKGSPAEPCPGASPEKGLRDPDAQKGDAAVIDWSADWSTAALFRLHQEGKQIVAFALLLLRGYVEKLAPAMRRTYFPQEIERGKLAAVSLLSGIPPENLEATVDRYCLTIDHMAKWIQGNPSERFVLPPSQWFSPTQRANIVGAERRWLQKSEQRKKDWEDAKELRRQAKDQADQVDQNRAKESDLYALALRLKKHLMAVHPNDHRLKNADLVKWEKAFSSLTKQGVGIPQISEAVDFLGRSQDQKAKFWRHKAQIRSASGLARNFHSIYQNIQN